MSDRIKRIFEKISQRMLLDFEESREALEHSGQKGSVNEEVVREFLRKYLPKNLDISTGCLVDRNGGLSKQLDVIISDAARTPILFENSDVRVIPAECAYSVIEVKARLDTKELENSYKNMRSVKDLVRDCYFFPHGNVKRTNSLYGRNDWQYWPINYFIFSYTSIDLFDLAQQLASLQLCDEPHRRIDLVCCLSKGMLLNHRKLQDDFRVMPLPESDTTIGSYDSERPLLLFYTLISQLLCQADMPSFNFHPYLGKMVL